MVARVARLAVFVLGLVPLAGAGAAEWIVGAPMKVRVTRAATLSRGDTAAWARLIESDPRLSSPFLRPEFTAAVASVRDDGWVGTVEDHGRPVGFLPFHRGRCGVGYPIGGALNDLQAFTVDRDVERAPARLVRGCGLVAWRAPRLLASEADFGPFIVRRHETLSIALEGGYGHYLTARRDAGINLRREQHLERKASRLEREVGPLRFAMHEPDGHAFDMLMTWRRERLAPTGSAAVYAAPWAMRLYRRVVDTQEPGFAGVLSTLHAGGTLAAVHLGIRSRAEWHSWAGAYNPALRDYSPGLLLFLRMAECAAPAGIHRIELGGGDYSYKRLLANRTTVLVEAIIDPLRFGAALERARRTGAAAIRRSPLLHRPARVVSRAFHRAPDLQR